MVVGISQSKSEKCDEATYKMNYLVKYYLLLGVTTYKLLKVVRMIYCQCSFLSWLVLCVAMLCSTKTASHP